MHLGIVYILGFLRSPFFVVFLVGLLQVVALVNKIVWLFMNLVLCGTLRLGWYQPNCGMCLHQSFGLIGFSLLWVG